MKYKLYIQLCKYNAHLAYQCSHILTDLNLCQELQNVFGIHIYVCVCVCHASFSLCLFLFFCIETHRILTSYESHSNWTIVVIYNNVIMTRTI